METIEIFCSCFNNIFPFTFIYNNILELCQVKLKNQLSVLSQKKGAYSKEKDTINMCKHLEECRKILEAKLFNAGI